jgi:hypothetical protein
VELATGRGVQCKICFILSETSGSHGSKSEHGSLPGCYDLQSGTSLYRRFRGTFCVQHEGYEIMEAAKHL